MKGVKESKWGHTEAGVEINKRHRIIKCQKNRPRRDEDSSRAT